MYTVLRPTMSAIVLCTAIFLLYQVAKVLHRLYFHPLRRFPGPKLAAATFWYETCFDVFKAPGGQFIYELDRLHSIYGPVVRCSPEEIHIRDSEFFDTLYAGPGHVRDKWERSNRANGSPGSTANVMAHDLHRKRRGALNPFFSKKAVMQLEEGTRRKVDSLCEKIKVCAKEDKIVDLGTAFTAVTLDVITEYSFDACYNCIEEPDFSPRWKRLMSGFDAVPFAKHFPGLFNAIQGLPRSVAIRLNADLRTFFETKDAIAVQARQIWHAEQSALHGGKEPPEKAKTIFHGIMRSSLPPEEKSIERMCDEAFVLIIAGAETTARVLTVIFSYLLQDEKLLTRLRKALEEAFKGGLPPSKDLEQIPLMRAVIQEGLRISAPVTNRQILIAPKEDLICHGFTVPRGTPTSMTLQNVLFDPDIFPNPNEFRPDRWIEAESHGERLDRYLVTFHKGNRSCLGLNIAYSELYLLAAALVVRFDMQLYEFDRKRDLETVRDCFVGMPSRDSRGLRAEVRTRST